MKGKKSVSINEFVDRYCNGEDVPLDVYERCIDLMEAVYEYNNPYPFNPSHEGCSSFHFFYNHVINPTAYIRPFNSLPPGNWLSIVSMI